MRTLIAFASLAAVLALGCASTPFRPTAFDVKVSGKGRAVVFIPGAATGGAVWDATVAHLGGNVEAHVITIAGFAGQPPVETAQPLLTEVRTQLARYLRDRGLRAVIVGHSLGAAMAWWLAIAEADVVAGIVAVDAPLFGMALEDPSLTAETFEPQARRLRDGMKQAKPEELAGEARERFGQMITDPAVAERYAAQGVKGSPAVLADALYQLFTLDLRPDAGTIRAPAVVLVAKAGVPDDKWPGYEAEWRKQVALVPEAEMIVVETSRHFIMLDDPEALFRALDAFLAAHP